MAVVSGYGSVPSKTRMEGELVAMQKAMADAEERDRLAVCRNNGGVAAPPDKTLSGCVDDLELVLVQLWNVLDLSEPPKVEFGPCAPGQCGRVQYLAARIEVATCQLRDLRDVLFNIKCRLGGDE
jgi:hypothetical protein